MKHLVVSITAHGFGHVAQTAPVLNALLGRYPEIQLTIRSNVSEVLLRSRVTVPFVLLPSQYDIGMVMDSALDVAVVPSRQVYQDFHRHWSSHVMEEATLLSELRADLVFSNVGYLPLAGAAQAGIPSLAMCSLNWFDIYRAYCGDDDVATQILQSYQAADAFLSTTPAMPMPSFSNLHVVGPLAACGVSRRESLWRRLQLSSGERLVLVSLGGIQSRLPVEVWPVLDGVSYLVPQSWQVVHPKAFALEECGLHFGDLLASCDALICKPGYGSFVEAACVGVPVLYVDRSGWPEAPALNAWLLRLARGGCVPRDRLMRGDLAADLAVLWRQVPPAPVKPTGVAEVVAWLARGLRLLT